MDKKRMTGADYRKEYKELNKSLESLKSHVDMRLRELLTLYPDAEISIIRGHGVEKIRCIDITVEWFDDLSTFGMIGYIEKIEKWSEEQQGVQQLKI
jgi:hypothetical protein